MGDWSRQHCQPGGGDAWILYLVFGEFGELGQCSSSRYDTKGVPSGNRLHALEGDRAGQHSISINDQWRICFRFEEGDA
jgi:hypothetical protein